MKPKFDPDEMVVSDKRGAVLVCAACGGVNTKQERIEVFDRKDDEDKGCHVAVEEGKVAFDMDMSRNPSARKRGTRIFISCKKWDAISILEIIQHKDYTFICHRTGTPEDSK